MSPNELLYLVLGIVVFDYVVDQILNWLNYKRFDSAIPGNLKGIYSESEYLKSQAYQKERARFSFSTAAFSTLLSLLVLGFGGFGMLDSFLRSYIESPIWLALAFFGVVFVATDIVNLPFSLYSTFVIEQRFGFNKTTISTFFLDKVKGYFLAILIGLPLGYALIWLVVELGADFWVYALVIIVAFMLFMNVFYTSLIMPLFNKLRPLEDGPLKSAIEAYTKDVDFPLTNVFVIDGSKRSTKANAFFSGLGKRKKIVLYDTLIERHSTEELVAVLAHEVGHYKKKHIVQSLVLSILQMAITLFILSLLIFNANLSLALGAETLGIHLNFIAFGILYTPISRTTGLFMNILSRRNEYQADEYAVKTFDGSYLISALKGLSKDSLSNLTPHPFYVFVNYSHPALSNRIAAMASMVK
jgi:STE24 endopeptidase